MARSRLRPPVLGLAVFVMVVVPASPAWAHGSGSGPSGSSNYRSTLVGISPSIPGLTVKVVDDGQHVVAVNSAATPLVILGYSGEPYLMVDRSGVWQNVRSPSLYLNRSSSGGLVYMPPGTDPHAPPLWQRVCRCDEAVWHDHRAHWGASKAPAAVAAAPGRYHLVQRWQIEMREGTSIALASGIVAWVPGPSPGPWLAMSAVAALAIVALGLSPFWRRTLPPALLALVVVDASRAAGVVDGHWGPFTTQLHALPYDGLLAVLLWTASLLVVRLALKGRPGAAWGAATVAAVTTLTEALPTMSGMWHSQIVTAYPPDLQRLLISLTLGIGAGLFAACIVLIERRGKLEAGTGTGSGAAPELGAEPETVDT